MKQIISDVWFVYNEVHNIIHIFVSDTEANEYEIAQVSLTDEEMQRPYEDLYNLCLEIAHDLNYILEGEKDYEI